jgi:hypothetical protein
MKIKFLLAAAALAGAGALNAATLSVATAVQSQPDASSAVIEVLPAGSEQPTPSDKVGMPPAGWIAVEVAGPFEGYVKNKNLTKDLDVIPGSDVLVSPKDGSGVLSVFAKGDKSEITGLHGSWTQIKLEKTLVGYIQLSPSAPSPAASAPSAPTAAAPAPAAPAPGAALTQGSPSGDVRLSRLYEGTLASTKTLLMPKHPYAWQILDASGKRIAYVDMSKLLMTDQIENYAGHGVVLLGSLVPVADSDDLVIEVVGLRLK